MIEIKRPKPNIIEVKDMTIPVLEDISFIMDEIHKEVMERREEHAKKYVAELLNNLLEYIMNNMTVFYLDNIEIWNRSTKMDTSGEWEEYTVKRWINKDEPRGSN